MRYAILGSNSFTGSSFAKHVLDLGSEVLSVSRSEQPIRALLPQSWSDHASRDRYLQADINSDLDTIIEALRVFRPDVVVNFAAQSMVGQSWDSPEDWYRTNVVGLSRLVRGLGALPEGFRFVHVTTPEVYGSTDGWIVESDHFRPTTPYAVSRAAGDFHLQAMHRERDFPVVFTRAANVYGPGQSLYRLIPRVFLSARLGLKVPLHGDGSSVRCFVHARDVAEATRLVAEGGRLGSTYHISTSEPVTIADLIRRCASIAGVAWEDLVSPAPERAGKDATYLLDSTRLRNELGWQPQMQLQEGLVSVLSWIDDNLDLLRHQPLEYVHRI